MIRLIAFTCFNPRTRKGYDIIATKQLIHLTGFNPRTRKGYDLTC